MEQNPYAVESPSSYLGDNASTDAEATRKKYLNHEASVKSIGLLYLLGGILGVLLCLVYIGMGLMMLINPPPNVVNAELAGAFVMVLGLVCGILGGLQVWSGFGVRKLNPPARIGAGVVAGIGLLGFPLGTLISAYFLYLLFSEKGNFVFSEAYKKVIAATPHIKYKTSILVWILVGLVVVFLLLGVVALLGSGR